MGRPHGGSAGAGQSYVSAGAAGLTGSVVPSGADPSSTGADGAADQVFAMASAVALTGCTVSMSNPTPLRGQTAETATVNTTTGAEVRLEADYLKARSVHSGIADGTGTAYFTLAIDSCRTRRDGAGDRRSLPEGGEGLVLDFVHARVSRRDPSRYGGRAVKVPRRPDSSALPNQPGGMTCSTT